MKNSGTIADENQLIAQALTDLVSRLGEYAIQLRAEKDQSLPLKSGPYPVPGIMWLDLDVPAVSNPELVINLRERSPSIRVIVLPRPSDAPMEAAMRPPGTCGYWRKVAGHDGLRLLNKRERTFVRWACSELTYVEIADKMCVSPRTIDGYREAVFEKLCVKTRVGLVIEAIRLGMHDPYTN